MSPLAPQLRVLIGKELRQVRRSKGALASATILPLLLMTVMPLFQVMMLRDPALSTTLRESSASVPPPMAQLRLIPRVLASICDASTFRR